MQRAKLSIEVDVESQLIKSQKWSELKRFYASKVGHQWELGWINLLQSKDLPKAAEFFSKSLGDPRYEEASYILLWKLGIRPVVRASGGPKSLRLYDAYREGTLTPLLSFLNLKPENQRFASGLLKNTISKLREGDLDSLRHLPRTSGLALEFAIHFDQRLKATKASSEFYLEFLADPWTKRVLDENRHYLFDGEVSKALRQAYSQRDGSQVKRILKALSSRLIKLSSQALSQHWKSALETAIEFDLEHITENILGYHFWEHSELSPRAISGMRDAMFSPEESTLPEDLLFWEDFFTSSNLLIIPQSLDPESLSLWQIRVEMSPDILSEALLRFPQEERFLLLWSLRQNEHASLPSSQKRWPENEKESNVVRKNLERAFEKSVDKLLWFERLRECGCSQDFYQYALRKIEIPVDWILHDLREKFLEPSTEVRTYLREQVSLSSGVTKLLGSAEVLEVLSYLTPAEAQYVLISRYVVLDIPSAILKDDYLDLFWDATQKVSLETSLRWQKVILDYIESKKIETLNSRHWVWIENAWKTDSQSLFRFRPALFRSSSYFPWEIYLESVENSKLSDLIYEALPLIPDDRLKVNWIQRCLDTKVDNRLQISIESLQTDFIRHSLLANWFQAKGNLIEAVKHLEEEWNLSPILNDQMRVGRKILELAQHPEFPDLDYKLAIVSKTAEQMNLIGGLDSELCGNVEDLLIGLSAWDLAWKWRQQRWTRSSQAERAGQIEGLLQTAFKARAIEEAQRIMIDQIFQNSHPTDLNYRILDTLLQTESVFKIKHLRHEFLDRAGRIFPLHREALKARSEYDIRAVLLWDSFYGDPLEKSAGIPPQATKRKYELWNLVESISHVETVSVFSKYMNILPLEKQVSELNPFLETAKRISQRLTKHYKKKNIQVILSQDLITPVRLSFVPPTIEVHPEFFNLLDEETWSAFVVGFFQIQQDKERGLYDSRRLMERFFHGMLLSGAPIAKLIRLWVWLSIREGLISSTILKASPEDLIEKLPFVNALIIFYLSEDFEQKIRDCGLIPA